MNLKKLQFTCFKQVMFGIDSNSNIFNIFYVLSSERLGTFHENYGLLTCDEHYGLTKVLIKYITGKNNFLFQVNISYFK